MKNILILVRKSSVTDFFSPKFIYNRYVAGPTESTKIWRGLHYIKDFENSEEGTSDRLCIDLQKIEGGRGSGLLAPGPSKTSVPQTLHYSAVQLHTFEFKLGLFWFIKVEYTEDFVVGSSGQSLRIFGEIDRFNNMLVLQVEQFFTVNGIPDFG